MDAALVALMQVAIGWLVLWCCVDRSRKPRIWWPFDYRTSAPTTPPEEKPKPRSASWRTRQTPRRPWQRSGS